MNFPILSTRITESTIVTLRDRARQVGELFGLDRLESTRFITAVSEVGRNAVQFAGGGTAAFLFKTPDDAKVPQSLIATISDNGPGIADIEKIWDTRANAKGRVPLGLSGARRLVDVLTIKSPDTGGTIVSLEMFLPRAVRRLNQADLNARTKEMINRKPQTPLQELERQNTEMLLALQELRERQIDLKQADERKNHFLAMLAHELRNPLGTLSMNLDVLSLNRDMGADSFAKCRDAMKRQTEQMGKLVDDLTDVSRISQGKLKLEKVPLEVNQLVTQAIEICSSVLEAKRHMVTLHQHGREVWIAGDPTRLKQALCNLINNAARYTPAEGQIDIAVSMADEASVRITIADNGIGISRELIRNIFDMFVQGDSDASPGGLGIGLTLVQRLLERHSGSVIATSDGLGTGSTFIVTLPLISD